MHLFDLPLQAQRLAAPPVAGNDVFPPAAKPPRVGDHRGDVAHSHGDHLAGRFDPISLGLFHNLSRSFPLSGCMPIPSAINRQIFLLCISGCFRFLQRLVPIHVTGRGLTCHSSQPILQMWSDIPTL